MQMWKEKTCIKNGVETGINRHMNGKLTVDVQYVIRANEYNLAILQITCSDYC